MNTLYVWGKADAPSQTAVLRTSRVIVDAFIVQYGEVSLGEPMWTWELVFPTDVGGLGVQSLSSLRNYMPFEMDHIQVRRLDRLPMDDIMVHVVEEKLSSDRVRILESADNADDVVQVLKSKITKEPET